MIDPTALIGFMEEPRGVLELQWFGRSGDCVVAFDVNLQKVGSAGGDKGQSKRYRHIDPAVVDIAGWTPVDLVGLTNNIHIV